MSLYLCVFVRGTRVKATGVSGLSKWRAAGFFSLLGLPSTLGFTEHCYSTATGISQALYALVQGQRLGAQLSPFPLYKPNSKLVLPTNIRPHPCPNHREMPQ